MMKPKLNKDQLQKLVLSTIGLLALLYCYFNFFLGPLNKSRATMTQRITDLQAKIGASKNEMKKATNLEQQATDATTRYAALKALTPEGAPIAWFPPRMKAFFANQQIDKATARLDSNSPFKQPELANWVRYTWLIELPQADFNPLGSAIAELENIEPLLSIAKLQIRATPDDPQFQQVTLTAATTLVKR
jgi:hypothetical protein